VKRNHLRSIRHIHILIVFIAIIFTIFFSLTSSGFADSEIDTTVKTSFGSELNSHLYLVAQNESQNTEIDQFRQEEIDSRDRISKFRRSKFLKASGRFLKLSGVVVGVGGAITGLAMMDCKERDENGD